MMDRDLAERLTKTGRCPECGSAQWWRGPQGGVAVNVACASCGFAVNVAIVDEQVAFAQIIPRGSFMRYAPAPERLVDAARPKRA